MVQIYCERTFMLWSQMMAQMEDDQNHKAALPVDAGGAAFIVLRRDHAETTPS